MKFSRDFCTKIKINWAKVMFADELCNSFSKPKINYFEFCEASKCSLHLVVCNFTVLGCTKFCESSTLSLHLAVSNFSHKFEQLSLVFRLLKFLNLICKNTIVSGASTHSLSINKSSSRRHKAKALRIRIVPRCSTNCLIYTVIHHPSSQQFC